MNPFSPLSTLIGNEAAVSVAFRLAETIATDPITPRSSMAELCNEWSTRKQTHLFAVLQVDSTETTFFASQGLLLTVPGKYKTAWANAKKNLQSCTV